MNIAYVLGLNMILVLATIMFFGFSLVSFFFIGLNLCKFKSIAFSS